MNDRDRLDLELVSDTRTIRSLALVRIFRLGSFPSSVGVLD